MVTVGELRRWLGSFPAGAPVGLLSVARVGWSVDVDATTIATVQASIADDGSVPIVWLIGAEAAPVEAPTIISWPCSCGATVVALPNDAWPATDHHDHRPDT